MEKKSETTPNPAEVKKQLEAIAGHAVDISPEQAISLWFPVGAYDYTDGNASWRSIIIAGKRCNTATLLDVSGVSSTGADGKRVFLLSDFVCFPLVRSLGDPTNVLATARATNAVFVTATHTLVNNNTDVQITVFAWNANGTPAANITFDWRCRVVSNQIIG